MNNLGDIKSLFAIHWFWLSGIHSSDRSQPAATGYRNNTSGALVNVGTWGPYNSSSSYASGNINASHLAFGSGDVKPLNTSNRANALSVRCVQHLRSCFRRKGRAAFFFLTWK